MTIADSPREEQLLAENEELRLRLEESQETLRAIGSGEVDAFVVSGPDGEQVFTLKGAEHPYRVLVETMNEGAATLAADGTILYCNNRLAAMLQVPLERLIGTQLASYVSPSDRPLFAARLGKCTEECDKDEITMITGAGNAVPVMISCCAAEISGNREIGMVITDLTQHKRNEETMAAEKLARSIIEQAGEAIIVCDEGGRIIRASRLANQLCGKNPLLQQFDDLFRLRIIDTECLFSVLTPLHGGSFESVEVEFKQSEDQTFHLLLNATPLKSDQNGVIGCIVTLTDITERRQVEESLRESENRLQSAYHHLQVNNEELQGQSEEIQSQSEELQAQSEELHAQNHELARLWEESNRDKDAVKRQNATLEGINKVLSAGLSCRTERDLGVACLEIAQKLTQSKFGFIGKINEQGLEDIAISNPGWDACNVVDANGHRRPADSFKIHGICGRVISEGKALFTNDPANHPDRIGLPAGHPPLTAFLGTPMIHESRVIGLISVANRPGGYTLVEQRALEALVPAIVEAFMRKRAEEALKQLSEELEKQVAERTADLAANIEKLKIETAERIQAVEALREKDQMLIQQSRQAAMGEMIGNIAHQWRQPLNTLGLTIQQLPLFYDLGEFNREILSQSVKSSMELIRHMSRTIDDFRNFFRPDKEKVEFKVVGAIANTLTLIEDSFKKQNITIEVNAKDDPAINGYRNEFAQVLLNILNNARDVLTEREVVDPMVTITIGIEGDRAVASVADNAGGIPEEIMEQIFDPYFTTKGPQGGTGVGLFMSKTIIEKNMGGSLSVRNIANGAEFRIEV